jgi:hypothetical protein
LFGTACSRFGAVYPPRPPAAPGPPFADPVPARLVVHLSVSSGALRDALEDSVPKSGEGSFELLGGRRHYTWERGALDLGFSQGRLVIGAHVAAKVDVRIGLVDSSFDLRVAGEPIVNTEYRVKLQSTEVKVTSSDRTLKVVDHVADVFDKVGAEVDSQVKDFTYDLRPAIDQVYARVATPIDIPVGDANGCAELRVLSIEAGPTVIADGIEKDIGIVVAPSITLPCESRESAPLPPLANVATMVPGPFTVTIPVAASYEELARAMSVAFTDGKLFFSPEYPQLFLEKPELYESQGVLVLELHLHGPVHKFGIDTMIDGDIFLTGHLALVDNELRIPDLEPTIETSNLLLSLKAFAEGGRIRDQARAALRLDIGQRLRAVRSALSADLTFGGSQACFTGDVDKIEVTGAYAHGTYVRVYVAVTARAAASLPCRSATVGAAADPP